MARTVVVPRGGIVPFVHPNRTPSTPDDSSVRAARDAYRSSVARSLEAARRHDQLRQRLHAIDAAQALVRLLFLLEGQSVPDADGLPDALGGVEEAQDWPAGYLRWALLNLVRDPAPSRQLELARRVERLLSGRGFGESTQADASMPASTGVPPLTAGVVPRAP